MDVLLALLPIIVHLNGWDTSDTNSGNLWKIIYTGEKDSNHEKKRSQTCWI